MGLDMYFYAEKYVSEYFEPELQPKLKTLVEELGITDAQPSGITLQLMYWRKANAIHKWFVDNVQRGKDDCERYPVYDTHLEELKELIDRVLADRDQATSLLPPSSGFFFGPTEITQYYWEQLEETSVQIGKILEQCAEGGPLRTWDFYYQSSW